MHLGGKKIAGGTGYIFALAARNTVPDLVSDLFGPQLHLRGIFTPSNYGGTEDGGK